MLDANPSFLRIATRFVIAHYPGLITVLGATGLNADGLLLVELLQPAIVLLGLGIPGQTGLAFIGRIHAVAPAAKVIVCGILDTDGYADAARSAGAFAFIAKTELPTDLGPLLTAAAVED